MRLAGRLFRAAGAVGSETEIEREGRTQARCAFDLQAMLASIRCSANKLAEHGTSGRHLRLYQPAYIKSPTPTNGAEGLIFPLQPLTLQVLPGEHVALVGASGAGKSTLMAGLSRLLPVSRGRLVLDGWEARAVPLSRWREALLCLPQQPLLLAGSIRHNLDPEEGPRFAFCSV
ncbi:cftr [Symbiodinium sp. KB8]|nr:cftr [Symbiodinium sp. KB8]